MFDKSEIITCYRYRDLTDTIYEKATGLDQTPEDGVIWTSAGHLADLFKLISGNGRSYVLISSFCDFGIALQSDYPVYKDLEIYAKLIVRQHGEQIGYQGINLPPRYNPQTCKQEDLFSIRSYGFTHYTIPEIPKEIKKWYLVNNQIPVGYDDRLVNIPCGVQMNSEDRWTEQFHPEDWDKREIMFYLNWMNYTLEREEIKQVFSKLNGWDRTIIKKEIPHDEFRDNLLNHRFVICPEGIGVDCYRPLEAIYCGAIPIVKNSATTQGLGLPVIFYDNIYELFNTEYLVDSVKSIQEAGKQYDIYEKARFSYWSNRINEERKLLLGGFYNND